MRDGVAIAPFNLDLSGIGNRPGTLALSGSLSKAAAITAAIEATPAGRKLTLNAGDAGLLLRGLFAFESMRGGRLSLTATLPGRAADPEITGATPDFTGKLDIDQFTMVHQALLTRLFSAGSLGGLGDLMGGTVSRSKISTSPSLQEQCDQRQWRAGAGPRRRRHRRWLYRPAQEPACLEGRADPRLRPQLDHQQYPLIGDVLASKKGEGIFGVTYSPPAMPTSPTSIPSRCRC
jgi:hypothetical protein